VNDAGPFCDKNALLDDFEALLEEAERLTKSSPVNGAPAARSLK